MKYVAIDVQRIMTSTIYIEAPDGFNTYGVNYDQKLLKEIIEKTLSNYEWRESYVTASPSNISEQEARKHYVYSVCKSKTLPKIENGVEKILGEKISSEDREKYTDEAIWNPRKGDLYTEMLSVWIHVLKVTEEWVYTAQDPAVSVEFRRFSHADFIKWLSYNKNDSSKGYWVDLHSRGNDVSIFEEGLRTFEESLCEKSEVKNEM